MTDEGVLIAGRYRLQARIGQGGMGIVWRATDEQLGRAVAIKQMSLHPGSEEALTEQAVQRATREARVAARLRHPHAVTVYDVVRHDGKPCLVMEFLSSRSLAAVLAEQGRLPASSVALIAKQIAGALAAAHEEGIVHRDVKPGNILITAEDTAKIVDFGVSRATGEATVTDAGTIVGTPAFLAPEVARGSHATVASDVFSLGATMYAALEGHSPFGETDATIALLARVARGRITPPETTGPVADVVSAMLRNDPAERPSMRQVHEAFVALVEGRTPVLPPPGPRTLVLPARRPRKGAAVAASAGVCLVAVGVVIGMSLAGSGAVPEAASPPNSATVTTTVSDHGCTASYRVTNTWPGGYQAEVTVGGERGRRLVGWSVTWRLPEGYTIDDVWNGVLARSGQHVTVSGADWNAVVPSGESTAFGFVGAAAGEQPLEPRLTCRTP
ncbi:serine/threonine protein kinase [Saccharomonospora marina XMU15]|uniref:non-specific serine/threonine protein kinase n=1 Tax=Saccharomonospora marina XMU15 TaxID=882083 RepID=H5X3Z3_9PSEU|nr:serine/threonine-protein kinase [Saccharomonospora marina]EHR52211.1 serine/threonine protein kinase [Saccharomonospora marina XMU15]